MPALAVNRLVAGSNPARGAISSLCHQLSALGAQPLVWARRRKPSPFAGSDRVALGTLAVLFASLALAAPRPSDPKECPVSEHSLDAIEAAIDQAASCRGSMDIFQACAYVASGDVPLGQAVIRKCEGDFLNKLNSRQKRSYENEIKRCWRKYRRESGTMYRSFEAMCAAGVAQAYSRRFRGGTKKHK
jgi:NAD(P)-dependent dehydrogenase (short-subunit alcohol dehydrogenase family)